MKSIQRFFATRILAGLSGLGLASASAETLFYDNFDGGAVNLAGTTPDATTGGAVWVGPPANFLADGTLGGTGAGTVTLAFTPVNGRVYTLDASFTGITGDANWIPLGFVNGQGTGTGTSGAAQNRFLAGQTAGTAWMFARGTNDLVANPANTNNTFLGSATSGNANGPVVWAGPLSDADGGNFDLRIVLDTTGGAGSWTATWYAKRDTDGSYTKVRDTAILSSESITSVGFGKSNTNVTGTIQSFRLSTGADPVVLKVTQNNGKLDFEWNSAPGQQYDLLSSTDLATAPETWMPYFDGVGTYENIPSAGTMTTLTGVARTGPVRFFALREEPLGPVTLPTGKVGGQ